MCGGLCWNKTHALRSLFAPCLRQTHFFTTLMRSWAAHVARNSKNNFLVIGTKFSTDLPWSARCAVKWWQTIKFLRDLFPLSILSVVELTQYHKIKDLVSIVSWQFQECVSYWFPSFKILVWPGETVNSRNGKSIFFFWIPVHVPTNVTRQRDEIFR